MPTKSRSVANREQKQKETTGGGGGGSHGFGSRYDVMVAASEARSRKFDAKMARSNPDWKTVANKRTVRKKVESPQGAALRKEAVASKVKNMSADEKRKKLNASATSRNKSSHIILK